MANEKKVLVEVERLLKADELGERMASGTEKLDWRRLSSEIESARASGRSRGGDGGPVWRELRGRLQQPVDERALAPISSSRATTPRPSPRPPRGTGSST